MPDNVPSSTVAPAPTTAPVVMITPQGNFVSVDPADAAVAMTAGFAVVPPDVAASYNRMQSLKAEEGGALGALKTAGEGAAQALTLGGSIWAEKALGIDPERIKAREVAHPAAHFIGTGVGVVGPALATAGGSIPEELAGAATEAAAPSLISTIAKYSAPALTSRIGEGVTSAIAGGLGKEGAGLGREILTQAVSKGTGAALEGAIYGASDINHEAALGDPVFTGQSVARLAFPALLAGTLGVGSGVLGVVAEKSAPKVGNWLNDYSLKQYGKALGLKTLDTDTKDALQHASDAGYLGDFATPEKFAAAADDGLRKINTTLEDITKAADGAPGLGAKTLKSKVLDADEFRQFIIDKAIRPFEGYQPITNKLAEGLDAFIAEKAPAPVVDNVFYLAGKLQQPEYDATAQIKLHDAYKFGTGLLDIMKSTERSAGREATLGPKVMRDLQEDMDDLIKKKLISGQPEWQDAIEARNVAQSSVELASKAIKASQEAELKSNPVGLLEVAEFMHSGIGTALVGRAIRYAAEEYGPAVAASLAKRATKVADNLAYGGEGVGKETFRDAISDSDKDMLDFLKEVSAASENKDRLGHKITELEAKQAQEKAIREVARKALGTPSLLRGVAAETAEGLGKQSGREDHPVAPHDGLLPRQHADLAGPAPRDTSAQEPAALIALDRHLKDTHEEIEASATRVLKDETDKGAPKTAAQVAKEPIEDIQARIRAIRAVANDPAAMAELIHSHLGDLSQHAPQTAQVTATTLATGVKLLADEAPSSLTPPSILDPSPEISRLDATAWATKEAAVLAPMAALNAGFDQATVMQMIDRVYPALAAEIRTAIASQLAPVDGKPITYQQTMRASMIMGSPLVPSQSPSAITAYQTAYITPPPTIPGKVKGSGGKYSKTQLSKAKFGSMAATPVQSIGLDE